MRNKFLKVGLAVFFLTTAWSCKKYLNINSDPATPQNPSNGSVFPAMLSNIPRGLQYDARYVGKYIQNWNASSASDTWDRMGYVAASDAAGDVWRQTYFGLGKNLDYIIQNGIQKNQNDFVGAGYALKALMFQYATDEHGPIIFHDAFKEETYYFKYDEQDAVYKGIDSLCRLAISYLSNAETSTASNTLYQGDFSYKGNVTLWKRMVYGILARNWNHLSNKSTYNADSVISFCDKSLTSSSDDFVVPFDATRNDDANFFGTYRDNLGSFRQSNFIVKLLDGTLFAGSSVAANRDPRLRHMLSASADTTNGNGGYRGVDPPNGDPFNSLSAPTTYTVGSTNWVNARKKVSLLWGDSLYTNPSSSSFGGSPGKYLFQNKSVMPIMTYSEIQFIKAEAAFRKGDKTTAYQAYLNGINGHFDFINRSYSGYRGDVNIYSGNAITSTERNNYLNGNDVKKTAATLTLTDIMGQKYIALWGWGFIETWVDLRRYHYNTDLDQQTGLPVYNGLPTVTSLYPDNLTSPNADKRVYRLRPRYNSEYVWNLDELKRFEGDKLYYHTLETWFSKP